MMSLHSDLENFTVSHPDGAFGLETRLRWSQGVHAQNRMHRQPLWKKLSHRLFGGEEQSLQAAFDHLPLLEADLRRQADAGKERALARLGRRIAGALRPLFQPSLD